MIKVYAGIRPGNGKFAQGKVCDDRILVGKQLLVEGYYECEVKENAIVVAVSDGVGGSNSGWKAAEVALEEIIKWDDGIMENEHELKKNLVRVNDAVISESITLPEYQGMAATLSVLLLTETNAKVLHVGDSRVYHSGVVQGHAFFKQITEDQNNMLIWQLEERNRDISVDDFKNMVGWNHITSYVGMATQSFAERMCVFDIMNSKGKYILTTDGIHDFVEKKELRKILETEGEWKVKLEDLMNMAVKNGSHDDQSIIIVEFV